MFAKRAYEVFGKFVSLIYVSANLTYISLLAFGFGLRFYIVLVVGICHGLRFGDHSGLGNIADKHAVRSEINVVYNL